MKSRWVIIMYKVLYVSLWLHYARACVCVCVVVVHESCRARGLWRHTGWVDTLHNQSGGWGVGGAVFTSARSAVPPYSLPILASRTRLNWHYHMTGILSTQQEVALQTVCFALFLKLELNGVGRESNRKRKIDCDKRRKTDFQTVLTNFIVYIFPSGSVFQNLHIFINCFFLC